MRTMFALYAAATLLLSAAPAAAQSNHTPVRSTIVLVHGQLDDASTWSDLLTDLSAGNQTSISLDRRQARLGRDDVSDVARSISAQLAPDGRLYGDRIEMAAAGGLPRVR
ncbi:hypothetical protein [Sphingomonas sp. DBB INV C78]|uniref:hypothetical protein n=1 Tax=Sphingomonas sp. DBB INV C78 TaxID=3349434 RepID=UPI0036D39227